MRDNQLVFNIIDSDNEEKQILSAEEMNEMLANESIFFQQEAEVYLKDYHRTKRMVSSTIIPSITSKWSDMPNGSGGIPNSQVEEFALRKVTSQEWINVFERALNSIDEDHKNIISQKYLGSFYPKKDDYVFDTLCMSRATYYRVKPVALEEFGRALYEHFFYHNSHSKGDFE